MHSVPIVWKDDKTIERSNSQKKWATTEEIEKFISTLPTWNNLEYWYVVERVGDNNKVV